MVSVPAASPREADVVVVNTCAFVEEARRESVDTILALADARADGSRLVVTGCLAERYGTELAEALPEVDEVAGFGVAPGGLALEAGNAVPVSIGRKSSAPSFDLLHLPRLAGQRASWAYVKIAEGCDRAR